MAQARSDRLITIVPNPCRVRVTFAGRVIAETDRALTLAESSYAPVQYIPRADVGRVFGKGDTHGFAVQVPFPAGTHQVCVYAIDASGTGPNPAIDCRSVG